MPALRLLLALALGPVACAGSGTEGAPEGDAGERAGREQEDVRNAGASPDTVAVTVSADPDPAAGAPLDLAVVLRNPGPDSLRLEFSSSQRFDFEVRTAGGEAVWRWSEGKFFTQVLGSEAVPPGDSLAYRATLEEGLDPGRYTVVGTITARERNLRDSVEVEVD